VALAGGIFDLYPGLLMRLIKKRPFEIEGIPALWKNHFAAFGPNGHGRDWQGRLKLRGLLLITNVVDLWFAELLCGVFYF
jgi:hypothetical protein